MRLSRLFIMCCISLGAGNAWADEIHLNKHVIEGTVTAETGFAIEVKTASGTLSVPALLVTRRVDGPTRLEQYETERDREPLTPSRHLELAAWCRGAALDNHARLHIAAALSAAPQNETALKAAGYVRLGNLWLMAAADRPAQPAVDPASSALVERLLDGWARLLAKIRDEHFSGKRNVPGPVRGRAVLRTIRSPLAIPAACEILGSGGGTSRRALAEFLATYDDDAALLNLSAMALVDPDAQVRTAANGELTRLTDRRLVLFMRTTLRCEVETIVRRAAECLARLGDVSAVDDLIAVLPAGGTPGTPVTPHELFARLEAMYAQPILVPLGDQPYEHPATLALPGFGQALAEAVNNDTPTTAAFRSFVQDALITVTGENYGFDIPAWQDWAARNAPSRRAAP